MLINSAAFGRLCVETPRLTFPPHACASAAFGRLCVETADLYNPYTLLSTAAFGRLCVETLAMRWAFLICVQPPSGGCVLKP